MAKLGAMAMVNGLSRAAAALVGVRHGRAAVNRGARALARSQRHAKDVVQSGAKIGDAMVRRGATIIQTRIRSLAMRAFRHRRQRPRKQPPLRATLAAVVVAAAALSATAASPPRDRCPGSARPPVGQPTTARPMSIARARFASAATRALTWSRIILTRSGGTISTHDLISVTLSRSPLRLISLVFHAAAWRLSIS